MGEKTSIKQKLNSAVEQVRFYWKQPPKGRYMSFKEIAAYSFGGIGACLIVNMSYTCLLAATNVFVTGTIGIQPLDMYVLYVIAVLSGIPLTGIRANIIDNTRKKAGKYRPYLLTIGIPTALLFIGIVWFPYDKLSLIFGSGIVFGREAGYVAKCAVVLLFNVLLQFFYYFFYDAYENLIHVLSPNSQERADVASVKSVVYSLGPSIVNLIMPIIAQNVFHTNQTDVRVYRLVYPILGVLSVGLLVIVYANTQEKIIQAKTHVVQIKFIDALKAVAKNKYFWIISCAGWLGFLESAYVNILYWLYNYGGACSGNAYGIIVTIYGNSSLWGMLMAPFCIRKWGKKKVQIVTNLFNILFIFLMIFFMGGITKHTIWLVLCCLYMNGIVGAFFHILNPSIQADIRDYQQYRTGERIDGMFAAVGAIGNIITLLTSSAIPALYKKFGMTVENARRVVNDSELMSRILPGGENKTVGQMLAEQAANGQDIYNSSNALYDIDGVLLPLLRVLIIASAVGAALNVIPFFFYDLTEKKQKAIVRVLKVRALFEDYGNNALNDHELVEAIDTVNKAKEMAVAAPKEVSKSMYKSISDKAERKAAKKAYKEALEYNEEIDISKFICEELNKFNTDVVKHQVSVYKKVYDEGLEGIRNLNRADVTKELAAARALPKTTKAERELRKFEIEIAHKKLSAIKYYNKYFGSVKDFVEPDISIVEDFFNIEDECDDNISLLSKELHIAKKDKDAQKIAELKAQIKSFEEKRKEARKASKAEMDRHAQFNRAAQPYIDARKLLVQQDNFSHLDDIAAMYDEAKARADEEDRIRDEKAAAKQKELEAELAQRKANKKRKK